MCAARDVFAQDTETSVASSGNSRDVFAQAETTDKQAAEESSTLESEVEAKLAEIRDETPPAETLEETPEKETPEETPKEEETPEKTPEEEETPEETPKDEESPILPAGYRRAALGSGWTSEEIDHFLETRPDEANAEFGNIFDKWQERSSLWSERGRELAKAGKKPEEKPETPAKESDALSHFDIKALKEANPGSEDLLDSLLAPLNATIDKVNEATSKLSRSEDFLRTTEENALRNALDDFFGSEGMKSHLKTYGAKFEDLTDEQGTSRMKLINEADIISSGAADHGQDLSVHEAMARAFIQVSHGSRGEQIRNEIRDSMKKRTKSTKGSHQKTETPDDGKPITEEELVRRTEERLRNFGNK